jgi:hypothetical protein
MASQEGLCSMEFMQSNIWCKAVCLFVCLSVCLLNHVEINMKLT